MEDLIRQQANNLGWQAEPASPVPIYTGSMAGKTKIAGFANPSSTRAVTYETIVWSDGSTSCDCNGWLNVRKGKPRGCRHTKTLEDADIPDRLLSRLITAEQIGGVSVGNSQGAPILPAMPTFLSPDPVKPALSKRIVRDD